MSEYQITTLDNKLKVVTAKMTGRESVAVGIWFKVGGRYEKRNISGVSHFIEHMLFKGTKKRTTKKIKEEIEGRGGHLNGFTSEDTTCYLIKIVKKHFPLALDVLSDMVHNSVFKKDEIEKERTVILEEIKMYMDMPMHFAHDLINHVMWEDYPLGMFVAGDFQSVGKLSRKDILDFYKKHYVPENALISVCGDIEHDDVVDQIKSMMKTKPKTNKKISFKKVDKIQKKDRYLFVEKETEQAHVVLGFPAFSRMDPERYVLALMHIIMGANMSSRLYEEVREKRGLAYEIRSGVNFYDDVGSFTVSAGVENSKLEQTLQVIYKEFSKIKSKGITAGELKRAKEYMLNQLFFAIDDTLDHMLWMGEKALHFGKLPSKEKICETVKKITCSDVQKVAKKIFNRNRLNVVVIGKVDKKRQSLIKKQHGLI